jgi:hypothetical protein
MVCVRHVARMGKMSNTNNLVGLLKEIDKPEDTAVDKE